MLSLTSIIALLSAASLASAGCFSGGKDGRFASGLKEAGTLEQICGLYSGDFEGKESRYPCGTDSYGTKWNFFIENKSNDKRRLSYDDCMMYLGDEAGACQYGGDRERDEWHVVSDPNDGSCLGPYSSVY